MNDIETYYKFLDQKNTEIRIIKTGNKPILTEVNSLEQFKKVIKQWNEKGNIYAGIHERIKGGTKSKDVIRVKIIPLDIDSNHPKNQAATDQELKKCFEEVQIILKELGGEYGKPLCIMTGNGYQLLFKIPVIEINEKNRNEIEQKIQAWIKLQQQKYNSKNITLDQIGDLARILKVPETMSVKGENTKERPFRLAKIENKSFDVCSKLREEILNIDISQPKQIESKERLKENDETRSAQEYREIVKLLFQKKTKEEIFQHMGAFVKWTNAGKAYQEHTFEKAQQWVEKKEKENELANCEDIWKHDEKGKRKGLAHNMCAKHLLQENNFITIGEERKKVWIYEGGIYQTGGEKKIGAWLQKVTEGHCKTNDINEVIGHVQRQTYAEVERLNNSAFELICVNNGILNINTGELSPHSPDIIFTQKIPWNYNPKATCPKIKKFFSDVLKSEDIPTIQEWAGFILFRAYFIKKALIAVGEKHTGKTTLINLLIKLVGEKNCSGVSLHRLTKDKFAASNMFNKLMNVYDDLPFSDIDSVGEFKIATGHGYITGEKKYGDQFLFKNHAKLTFATNKISEIKDSDDDAYYDRWIIIFFNNVFDNSNPNTNRRLIYELTNQEEMEGFLLWAIEGLKRIIETQRFSYNKTAQENKLIMQKSSNTISAFVQECLINESGLWISKEDLYHIYSEYVLQFGGSRQTKEKFGRDLPLKATYIQHSQKDVILPKAKRGVTGWLNVGFNKGFNTFFKTLYTKYIIYTIAHDYINDTIIRNIIVYKVSEKALKVLCERIPNGIDFLELKDCSEKALKAMSEENIEKDSEKVIKALSEENIEKYPEGIRHSRVPKINDEEVVE